MEMETQKGTKLQEQTAREGRTQSHRPRRALTSMFANPQDSRPNLNGSQGRWAASL